MDKAKVMGIVNVSAPVLVSIGALNWGLIGLLEKNLLEDIFGDGGSATSTTTLAKIIYIAIGASAIYTLGLIPMVQKKLKEKG